MAGYGLFLFLDEVKSLLEIHFITEHPSSSSKQSRDTDLSGKLQVGRGSQALSVRSEVVWA